MAIGKTQYGSLPFKEGIAFFRAKLNLPGERWTDVWKEQHDTAFTVAGAMTTSLLADLRKAVDSAIAEGKSLNWFKREFKNIVKRTGWEHTGDAAWRAGVIYDTNMRQSYNAGRYRQLQNFEFWRYVHGDSRSPRPAHLANHNKILPRTSPWWDVWFPQNGWGCKCRVVGETKQSLARKKLQVSPEPVIEMREWTDKKTGEVHWVAKGIDPGFDYAPGKVSSSEIAKQQVAEQPPLAERLPERLVPSAFSTVPGVNVHRLNEKLQELMDTSAAPEVTQLSAFIKKHDVKTLFIKQAEMNPKAVAATKIVADVQGYVGKQPGYHPMSLMTTKGYLNADGFTSRVFNHVVIKTNTEMALSRAVTNEIRRSVDAVVLLKQSGQPAFTLSDLIKRFNTNGQDAAILTNWLHEIGHQVHYKAGLPNSRLYDWITTYGQTNSKEWHAELFVMWVLNRKALESWNKDIALYFDNLMKQVLQ